MNAMGAMSQPNKRIGDYEILEELGSGGMGRVYRVRNTISDRIEAMKVLLPNLAGQHELAARFLREIKLLASLNHPNIAALRTAISVDNQLVMIMEYVEGVTLASRLERGAIPVPEALNYIEQVLTALSYAHQQRVIHRDIKPANMMVTPEGVVKLMDFGIAQAGKDSHLTSLTLTGTTLGSINYMSPEQVKGEATDERSDLYSVGISLYEMVTGQRPFQADSSFSIMTAHVKEAPRPPVEVQPGLPASLNQIILTAIAKSPAERFQSAEAFRSAVSNVGQQLPTILMPGTIPAATPVARVATVAKAEPVAAPLPPPPPRQAGRRGLYMTLGALIVLGVLLAAGLYVPGRGKASEPVATPPPDPPPAVAPEPAPPPVQVTAPKVDRQAEERLRRQLMELEQQVDQLSSRAAAVNASLDRLQQQQAAAGYGLRGDMVARQATMQTSLARAQRAVEQKDPARAKRYVEQAENDVETLEHFLGR